MSQQYMEHPVKFPERKANDTHYSSTKSTQATSLKGRPTLHTTRVQGAPKDPKREANLWCWELEASPLLWVSSTCLAVIGQHYISYIKGLWHSPTDTDTDTHTHTCTHIIVCILASIKGSS